MPQLVSSLLQPLSFARTKLANFQEIAIFTKINR